MLLETRNGLLLMKKGNKLIYVKYPDMHISLKKSYDKFLNSTIYFRNERFDNFDIVKIYSPKNKHKKSICKLDLTSFELIWKREYLTNYEKEYLSKILTPLKSDISYITFVKYDDRVSIIVVFKDRPSRTYPILLKKGFLEFKLCSEDIEYSLKELDI